MADADVQAQKPVRKSGSNKCPHHNGHDVVYACEDCRELACIKCVTDRHRRHALEDLGEVIPEVNKTIQACVDKLEQSDIPRMTEKLRAVSNNVSEEKRYYKEQIQEIEEKQISLKEELDNINKTLINKCKDSEQHSVDELVKCEKQIQLQLDDMKSNLDKLKENLRSGSNVEKYDVANNLPSYLNEIPSPTCQRTKFVQSEISVAHLQQLYGEVTLDSAVQSSNPITTEENRDRNVLTTQHKLVDTVLNVTECIPPPRTEPRGPFFDNKVMVKGLNPQTSARSLRGFIEAETGVKTTYLVKTEEEGVFLISFEQPFDFEKVQNVCQKRSLDDCYLHVQRVPISKCIKVSGFNSKTTSDTVLYYFENTKRSGGRDVEDVKLNKEEGFCLVYFKDHSVIDSVCKRKHIIDGSKLHVQLHLAETSVEVTSRLTKLMAELFDAKVEDLKKIAQCYIELKDDAHAGKVVIISSDLEAVNIRKLVDTFLKENAIHEKTVDLPDGIMRHITQENMRDIEKISIDLESDQVQINCRNKGITIKGTELGVIKAHQRVNNLLKEIRRLSPTNERPGFTTLAKSGTVKPKVERDERVTTPSCHDAINKLYHQYGGAQMGKLVQEVALCSMGNYTIHCSLGDITKLDADVLVIDANKDLKHIGGLAKDIIDKGGISIQNECSDHVKRRGRMMEGGIFLSRPGSLACNAIVHAVVPQWRGGNNQEGKLLKDTILECMETASDRNMSSIAIPTLGTGLFGIPSRVAVNSITGAVSEFFQDNNTYCITRVYLCDVKMEHVNLFIESLKCIYGTHKVKETPNIHKQWSVPTVDTPSSYRVQRRVNTSMTFLDDFLHGFSDGRQWNTNQPYAGFGVDGMESPLSPFQNRYHWQISEQEMTRDENDMEKGSDFY